MKIIKEGNLKHPIVFECHRCHCVFEAEEGEYIPHDPSLNPMTRYDTKYVEVTCPCCGSKITEHIF